MSTLFKTRHLTKLNRIFLAQCERELLASRRKNRKPKAPTDPNTPTQLTDAQMLFIINSLQTLSGLLHGPEWASLRESIRTHYMLLLCLETKP